MCYFFLLLFIVSYSLYHSLLCLLFLVSLFVSILQCDQIGRFFKVLGGKLSYKSSPNVWWLKGHFENISFEVKTAVVTFLGNFIKNWATFLIHCLVALPSFDYAQSQTRSHYINGFTLWGLPYFYWKWSTIIRFPRLRTSDLILSKNLLHYLLWHSSCSCV